MIFILLDYNKIHKKLKFSALDIVESRVKRCGCNLSWHNSKNLFKSMINTFIFRCAKPDFRIIIIILPTDQPDMILPTGHTTNN